MRKPGLAFMTVLVIAGVVIGYLFLQLRGLREAAAQLREQVAQLEKAVAAAGVVAPAPLLAQQPSPSVAPTVLNAPPATQVADTNLVPKLVPLFSSAMQQEMGLTSQEAAEFRRLLREGSDTDLAAFLGADRYEQYQQIQRTARREQQVSQFRASLAGGAYALADAQVAQLDLLLEAEQRRRAATDKARTRPTALRAQLEYDEALLKETQAANQRVLAGMRSFLSPEQVTVLRNQLDGATGTRLDSLREQRAKLDAGGR